MAMRTNPTYRALDLVPIPEDTPKLDIKVGDLEAVDFVYDDGRGLHTESGREDGTSVGFVQLEAEAGTDSTYFWRAVAYYPFKV